MEDMEDKLVIVKDGSNNYKFGIRTSVTSELVDNSYQYSPRESFIHCVVDLNGKIIEHANGNPMYNGDGIIKDQDIPHTLRTLKQQYNELHTLHKKLITMKRIGADVKMINKIKLLKRLKKM